MSYGDITPIWRLCQIGLVAIICWAVYGIYKVCTRKDELVIKSHTLVVPTIKTIVITDGVPDTTFIYKFK